MGIASCIDLRNHCVVLTKLMEYLVSAVLQTNFFLITQPRRASVCPSVKWGFLYLFLYMYDIKNIKVIYGHTHYILY